MAMNTPETGMKQTDSPKVLEKKFAEMHKRLDTPENTKREEYLKNIKEKADWYFERLPVKGGAVLMRIEQMQEDPNSGADNIQKALETLKELYSEAVEMRAEMFPDTMRKAMKLEKNADIEGELGKGLEELQGHEGKNQQTFGNELGRIALGLAQTPSDVLSAGNTTSRYWYMNKATGFPDIKQYQVAEDQKFVLQTEQQLKGTQTLKDHPEIQKTIEKIKTGLLELRKVNPTGTAMYDWQVKNAPRKMDTKPLRVLGILSGGLIAGLGIGHSLYTGKELTWPTAMWAGVAAYSLNPKMFQGREKAAIESFQKYNSAERKKILSLISAEAFEEFTDLSKEELKTFRKKVQGIATNNARNPKSRELLTKADIGTIAREGSPLYVLLVDREKLNQDPRRILAAVDLILTASKNDIDVIREMIEHK